MKLNYTLTAREIYFQLEAATNMDFCAPKETPSPTTVVRYRKHLIAGYRNSQTVDHVTDMIPRCMQ